MRSHIVIFWILYLFFFFLHFLLKKFQTQKLQVARIRIIQWTLLHSWLRFPRCYYLPYLSSLCFIYLYHLYLYIYIYISISSISIFNCCLCKLKKTQWKGMHGYFHNISIHICKFNSFVSDCWYFWINCFLLWYMTSQEVALWLM